MVKDTKKRLDLVPSQRPSVISAPTPLVVDVPHQHAAVEPLVEPAGSSRPLRGPSRSAGRSGSASPRPWRSRWPPAARRTTPTRSSLAAADAALAARMRVDQATLAADRDAVVEQARRAGRRPRRLRRQPCGGGEHGAVDRGPRERDARRGAERRRRPPGRPVRLDRRRERRTDRPRRQPGVACARSSPASPRPRRPPSTPRPRGRPPRTPASPPSRPPRQQAAQPPQQRARQGARAARSSTRTTRPEALRPGTGRARRDGGARRWPRLPGSGRVRCRRVQRLGHRRGHQRLPRVARAPAAVGLPQRQPRLARDHHGQRRRHLALRRRQHRRLREQRVGHLDGHRLVEVARRTTPRCAAPTCRAWPSAAPA